VRDVPKAETAQAVLEVADEAILLMEDRLQVAITRALKAVVAASGNAAAARIRKAVQVKDLRAAADDAFTFDKTNPKAVQWVTRHAAETISGISKTTREDIREAVEEAFTEQRTVDELAKDIADIIGDDERAEVIARTETMRASNAGQELAWEQAKDDGLLTGNEKKEWIVTPDDRLCPVCEPMDGVQVPLGESFSVNGEQLDGPPAHPNCRCAMGLSLS
jgi:SPP1 gp7 family putative phage head morphogenesis protein